MSTLTLVEILLASLALAAYTVMIITIRKKNVVNKFIAAYVTLGISFDIMSVYLMFIGSSHSNVSVYAFLKYSALGLMLIVISLLWKIYITHRQSETLLPNKTLTFTRLAYGWWVIVYVITVILVVVR